jgi:hypothetical protein
MATLALSLAGQFAGALVGGPIGATVGRALGALAGSAIDGWLFSDKKSEHRAFDVRLGGSVEGAAVRETSSGRGSWSGLVGRPRAPRERAGNRKRMRSAPVLRSAFARGGWRGWGASGPMGNCST